MFKSFAPRCRYTRTSAPHHSIFYRPDALPDAQPTVSKQLLRSDVAGKVLSLTMVECAAAVADGEACDVATTSGSLRLQPQHGGPTEPRRGAVAGACRAVRLLHTTHHARLGYYAFAGRLNYVGFCYSPA